MNAIHAQADAIPVRSTAERHHRINAQAEGRRPRAEPENGRQPFYLGNLINVLDHARRAAQA